jgi:hypothetical protein
MRPSVAALVSASLVVTGSCYHSTQLAATWREPNVPPLHFRRTVTVFVTKDEALRRSVEDKLASRFAFLNTAPSYTVLTSSADGNGASSDGTNLDRSAILQRFRNAGFDGAIVMRVTDVALQTTYVPGAYWYGAPYGFAGYWNLAWASPYDPYYAAVNQVVTVETQIYSLTPDRLVFAARSETTNPASAHKLTDSVIRHILEELTKDGLVTATGPTPVNATHAVGE